MKIIGYGKSDIGKVRSHNEDSFCVNNDLRLYMVCDGVGGHQAGEVASKMATNIIKQKISDQYAKVKKIMESEVEDSVIIRFMETIVHETCKTIFDFAHSRPEYYKMGTTLTLLLMLGPRAIMIHVGDSRLYLIRDDQVHQLSNDHTLAHELLRIGLIEKEDVKTHRFHNVLSRAIGPKEIVHVDTLLFDVLPDDIFILCSDGLTTYLDSPEDILETFDVLDIEKTPQHLIDFANNKGGKDNISVIVIQAQREQNNEENKRKKTVTHHVRTLGNSNVFHNLFMRELLYISNIAEEVSLRKGEILYKEGKIPSGYYQILTGEIALSHGTKKQILKAEQGCGYEGLLDREPAYATAQATMDSTLLKISFSNLNFIIRRYPRLGQKIYRNLSREILKQLGKHWKS